MTVYLLDADIFIQAKNEHYGFDICPGFWEWLVKKNQAGTVRSIESVADELREGDDDLAGWARARGDDFFWKPDDAVTEKLRAISDWAYENYESAAAEEFLKGADCWLVAHACAHKCTVVTHEKPSPPSSPTRKRIKIPDACKAHEVDCLRLYEMLRHEGAKFVLGPD